MPRKRILLTPQLMRRVAMRKSVKKKANLVMMTLLGMQILNNPWGFATTGLKYLVRAAMTLIVEYDQL